MKKGEGGRKEGFSLPDGASSAWIWAEGSDGVGETIEEVCYPMNQVSL